VEAAPPRAGGEFTVNTYTAGTQFLADVAVDASGRFVVVWESMGQDGDGRGIFGQRFRHDGTPLGGEFQINTTAAGDQFTPQVAAGAGGSFAVVWTGASDGSGTGVFARVYDAAGNPAGGEFAVNAYTTSNQLTPSLSVDLAGNVVMAWRSDEGDGASSAIRARRFNGSGTPLGGEITINAFTTGPQFNAAVAAHADGSFVVAWDSFFQDGNAQGVFARRFTSGGAAAGGDIAVNTFVTHNQERPQVTALPGGAFAIVWQSINQDGNVAGVFARRFDNAGNPAGGEIAVNAFTTDAQQFPAISADAAGNFTVAWESWGSQDGSGAGAIARGFDPSGAPLEAEFSAAAQTLFNQRAPSIAVDPDGRFVVAWHADLGDGSGYAVRAQRFGDLIFRNGFETGGLSGWSTAATGGGDLTASGAAALAGTTVGLRANINDTAGLFVHDDSPTDEARYRARFYLDPNGFDPGESQQHRRTRAFIAFSEGPARRVAAIVLRRLGGVYSVMGRARRDDNSQANTPFVTITDAPHAVEIELVRASAPGAFDGTFEMWVDGVSAGQLTGLDNDLSEVDFARLGALSVKTGAAGVLYFDEFESRRETAIGLLP
jgi:hypothetical protein